MRLLICVFLRLIEFERCGVLIVMCGELCSISVWLWVVMVLLVVGLVVGLVIVLVLLFLIFVIGGFVVGKNLFWISG